MEIHQYFRAVAVGGRNAHGRRRLALSGSAFVAISLDVRVFPAIVKMGVPGELESWEEYFQIRAVNHGREAVVTASAWWIRARWLAGKDFPKNWLVLLAPDDPYSTKLRARLEFGADAKIFLPTKIFFNKSSSLLKHVKASKFPSLTVRLLRVGVVSSTGHKFRVPLDAPLRKFVLERSRQVEEE